MTVPLQSTFACYNPLHYDVISHPLSKLTYLINVNLFNTYTRK